MPEASARDQTIHIKSLVPVTVESTPVMPLYTSPVHSDQLVLARSPRGSVVAAELVSIAQATSWGMAAQAYLS